ncbi:hypothetical protein [Vreelandella populi]|uniref:Uncharacterized protein n=1 Tax=Vreelandella populi TaxID=2498858 RepID=A0A3S0Z0S8_9GAMM|nr:hypothetical protein [Halomonas populi]RUR48790.1 hypothetical protein ELY37_02770 [Halomonas populi]
MSDWLTKDEAVDRFMYGKDVMTAMINLPFLVGLIHEALERDGHHIEIQRVWSEVIIPPFQKAGCAQAVGSDDRFQLPTAVYLHYADWMARIELLMGINIEADIIPDWRPHNPCVSTVSSAMASVAAKVSVAASRAYEQQHGHSMIDVFLASSEAGEDFNQTQARLTAKGRGLEVVK